MPAVSPVTIPDWVIFAVPVPGVMDHVPPVVASENAGVKEPIQTEAAPPPIGSAEGVWVTVSVTSFEVTVLAPLQFVM